VPMKPDPPVTIAFINTPYNKSKTFTSYKNLKVNSPPISISGGQFKR